MSDKMRILVVTDEEWNDAVFGNNILTNWFSGFEAEFAHVYCSPGLPYNTVCDRYFQITDMQMFRSLLPGGKRAGGVIRKPVTPEGIEKSKQNAQRQGGYRRLKQLSLHLHSVMLAVRDALWRWGRYDERALEAFVKDFHPDLVFCPRVFSPKLMRLERKLSRMTDAPFVALTTDIEAPMKFHSWSPLFWWRTFEMRHAFRKQIGLYKYYFTFSEEQAEDYHRWYGIPTSTLYKCGNFSGEAVVKPVHQPIRLVYAGRLYCGRWRTLAEVGKALSQVNAEGVRMILDVYTTEELTRQQRKAFAGLDFLHIHPAISPQQLEQEYLQADVALHVESFEKGSRTGTRYSFSTKIIDLMASSCAIMAICWEHQAGYQYLKKQDAAFCVCSYSEILPMLERLVEQPALIPEYAGKAWRCGKAHHTREIIQQQMRETFRNVFMQAERE